ncbi:tRNA(fMet)-specific endonuclease VapC [Metallosphaera sp. J1]|uniref:type II toxin-antitoxin system VapC family toxin n=1 Tax=Metallosphaera TaxID=41980 RepID=UPI001EDD46CF|nr:PIN domain-containing protein [Metallosphaera javensis (ex Hofmann et al. 2022)]MCG3110081.1 tRNA(fMet)-specific endonuclease VapC [Metallosphaera javensis (ex Hofmann et al. 2022)]BCS93136.1 MAG: tRNA(fMet)-specific endonuclease VapC [Metallosphaera javensis (ex Sakai et al. 2022)]
MRYYIDTSVLVAYALEGDPNHKKAVEIISSLNPGSEKVISSLTLAELYSVFSRRVGELEGKALVKYLLRRGDVSLVDVDFNLVFRKLELAWRAKLKTLDLLHLIISNLLGAEMITLDEELREAFTKLNEFG